MQQLNKQCYNEYIPRTLKVYIFERPFVHLYIANRKRVMVCFLENMKAVELPRKQITSAKETQSSDESDAQSDNEKL